MRTEIPKQVRDDTYKPSNLSENERREKINLPKDKSPPERRRKNIIKIPIDPNDRKALASFSGRRRLNIFEPSNGGIGIRLKIASKRFSLAISVKINIIELKSSEGWKFTIILTIKLARIAKIIFVKGPDSETSAISFLPSRRLNGSTGTGFAAPIIIGEPEIRRIKGKAILIMGSICFLGSRVSLPARRAVGSPKRSATKPWAISCKMAEKIKITKNIRPDPISILFKDLEYDIIFVYVDGTKMRELREINSAILGSQSDM